MTHGERRSDRSPARRSDGYGVVLAASYPPPVAGQSVATVILEQALRARGTAAVLVNLSKPFRPTSSRAWSIAKRSIQVLRLPLSAALAARRLRGNSLIFYLQIGNSRAALARDLPLLLLARALRARLVVHSHMTTFRDALEDVPDPMRRLLRRLLSNASRAIVLTPSLRDLFVGILPLERIAVAPNGVEPEVIREASLRAVGARRRSGLTVLYLANLVQAKGYETVLGAAKLAQAGGRSHLFVLAGAPTEMMGVDPARLVISEALTNVELMGPVRGAQKFEALAQADLLVLPSEGEGQPICILEAMHFGIPVIATRVGGIPETVMEGETGLLIPPRDPGALLDAIDRLAADEELRTRMGQRGRAIAQAVYTPEAHSATMLAIFDEVAREPQRW
jgi:glycosyltransferase involved in cell wall biosynthesis